MAGSNTNNGKGASIGIEFYVSGGTSINTGSGKRISDELTKIVQALSDPNTGITKLDFHVNKASITQELQDAINAVRVPDWLSSNSGIGVGSPAKPSQTDKNRIAQQTALRALAQDTERYRDSMLFFGRTDAFTPLREKIENLNASSTTFGKTLAHIKAEYAELKTVVTEEDSAYRALQEQQKIIDKQDEAAARAKASIGNKIDRGNAAEAEAAQREQLRLQKEQEAAARQITTEETRRNDALSRASIYLEQHREGLVAIGKLDTYQKLVEQLRQGAMAPEEFKRQVSDINRELVESGKNATDFGARLQKSLSGQVFYTLASTAMRLIRQALRQIYQNVVDIDTAMTELKKVTDETSASYNAFLSRSGENAVRLGASISDIVNATADFARLGYTLSESESLAQAAIVYKNVGDGIADIGAASESIISTMRAFDIDPSQAMAIIDMFNAVGNTEPISSAGIGEALQRSASALANANNTLGESIALAAAANSVVQNPEQVGTALKTLSMYLRAAKTEAEEAGESTEGMAESTSKLREQILQLTKGQVDIMADANNFKSSYQILKEMSAVWKDIEDVDQANLLALMGGKRNANVLASILDNFDIAERALGTTANSTGSALAENAKYLDSIQGRLSQLNATFQDFSQNVLSSDLVKGFVSTLTVILDIINKINKGTGGTLVALGSLFALFKLFPLVITAFGSSAITAFSKTTLGIALATFAGVDFEHQIGKLTASMAGFQAAAGWIALIGAALYGVYKIIEYNSQPKRLERALESLKEAKNNLDDIDSQLQTITEKVAELNKLKTSGEITAAQEAELKLLKAQTAELEAQRAEREADEEKARKATISSLPSFSYRTFDYYSSNEYGVGSFSFGKETYQEEIERAAAMIRSGTSFSDLALNVRAFIDNNRDAYDSLVYYTGSNLKQWQEQSNAWMEQFILLRAEYLALSGSIVEAQNLLLTSEPYSALTDKLTKLADAGTLTDEVIREMLNGEDANKLKGLLQFFVNAGMMEMPANFRAFEDWWTYLTTTDGADVDGIVGGLNEIYNGFDRVAAAASVATGELAKFKDIADGFKSGADAIKKAQEEMTKQGFLSVDTILALEAKGLTNYLSRVENGYALVNGALDDYLDKQGAKYQAAVNSAIANASQLAQSQEVVTAAYAGNTDALLTHLRALQASAMATAKAAFLAQPGHTLDGWRHGGMAKARKELAEYSDAIAAVENAIANRDSYEGLLAAYTYGGSSSSGSKKSAGDLAAEAWKKRLAEQKHLLEMGIITEEQYYRWLAENYRKDLGTYEETLDERRSADEDYFKWLKKQYQDDLNDQKKSLEDKKNELKDFYDAQKKMLEDQRKAEEEEDKRGEYAKQIAELETLIGLLRLDSSQEARRRLAEAEADLAEAQKEYTDWEKDNAYDAMAEALDKEYEDQAKAIDEQISGIEDKVSSLDANTAAIYEVVKEWAVNHGYAVPQYAGGTHSSIGGLASTQESGAELIGMNVGSGRFTYLTPKSTVWSAKATSNLYRFANAPAAFMRRVASRFSGAYGGQNMVTMGDIVINGNADAETVAKLKQERKNIAYEVLAQFKKLKA